MSHQINEISYDQLLTESPSLSDYNICFLHNWSEVFSGLKYFCIRNTKNQKIQAAFCLYYSKRKGFVHISNPPYFQNCGLWLDSRSGNVYESHSLHKKLLSTISDFVQKCKWVNISFPAQIKDIQHFIWGGMECVPRYTYLLNIEKSKDLLPNMSKGLRRDISRIEETGIIFQSSLSREALSILYQSTAAHRGAEEEAFWNPLISLMKDKPWFTSSTASLGDRNGVACFVRVGEEVIYLFGGADKVEGVPLGTAALWNSVSNSRDAGAEILDFEGSMIHGVERYFRSFGGELTLYFNIQKEPKIISTARLIKS